MRDYITARDLAGMFAEVASIMELNEDILRDLDARMGDGDLGLTMKKGFGSIAHFIGDIEDTLPSKVLMKIGMKMAAVVPSTMGTLMASGIMSGGRKLGDSEIIDNFGFCQFLNGFVEGIERRGKCKLGERTVLDSIGVAAKEVQAAYDENPEISLSELAEIAVLGAEKGMLATKTMVPVYGKAAIHKEAAKGYIDQGAFAGYYMIQGFRNYICNR